MRSRLWSAGAGVALTGAAVASACGGDHQFNNATDSSDAGAAGAETSSTSAKGGAETSTNAGGESAGTGTAAAGGVTSSAGGSDGGVTAGAGGADGNMACTEYVDWLRATFPYPNGILGAADSPSMPWYTASGAFKTMSGWAVATGASTAVLNQGKAFAYAGTRLRFKTKLATADQEIVVALNANSTGAGGVSLHLGAETGALSLFQGGKSLASTMLGALEPATEYFVSVTFTADGGLVDVASGNFAGVPGATPIGSLTTPVPTADTGSFIALAASGTGASFDNVAVAECGGAAPTYEMVVLDRFNRANSQSIGGPEKPVGQTYSGDDDAVQISNQTLAIVDHGYLTIQPGHLANAGLRLRAAVKFGSLGWMTLSYNTTENGNDSNGFDLWRQDDKSFFIEYRSGNPAGTIDVPLKLTEPYFVEFDVDGAVGVVTLRTTSYTGPIVAAVDVKDIVEGAANQGALTIGNTWMPSSIAYDEYSVERLTAP